MKLFNIKTIFEKAYIRIYSITKSVYYIIIYGSSIKFKKMTKNRFWGKFTIVMEAGNESIRIGENFVTRNNCRVRCREGSVIIGDNVFLNNNVSINSLEKIKIGDNCIIGENVSFYDHDHKYSNKQLFRDQGFKKNEIIVGNNVWIGSNAIILRGANIGNNVVIGAGVIVKGVINDNTIIYSKNEYIIREISE